MNITDELTPKFKTDVWRFIAENVNLDWQLIALLLNDLYIFEPK